MAQHFNPAIYLALNPDLSNISLQNANKHYLEIGQKEGRKIHISQLYPDFRHTVYLSMNPDLTKYKLSQIYAELHWLQHGRHENRQYKPLMVKDYIILYTDNENKERCEEFGKNLEKIGVSYRIKDNGNLNTNHLYIYFTLKDVKNLPFYFILNLNDYKINVTIMDLALAICFHTQISLKYNNKLFYINSTSGNLNEKTRFLNVDTSILIKRLLVSIDYLGTEQYNISVELDKIHFITNFENIASISNFKNQPNLDNYINLVKIVYFIKNKIELLGVDQTVKQIVNQAKLNQLPYVIIAKDNLKFSKNYNNFMSKTLNFLDNIKIEWEIITDGHPLEEITNLTEIIQIDSDIEILRTNLFIESNFMVFNNTIYDYILEWNNSISLSQHLKMRDMNNLCIQNLFLK
jgi:hypothetical protein